MENRVLFILTLCTVTICQGWSIQVNRDFNRKQEADVKYGKHIKREYQAGSSHFNHQQSPSPVNYYQNTPHYHPAYDLKPPDSPWSNQFYQPNHQFQQQNLASLLAKCSERNLYYCKELLAKQLVQHVREMVTYRSGLDPYLLSVILGNLPSIESWRTPLTHTEIRTETDLLDNEIPHYGTQISFQRPDKGHFYPSSSQWTPGSSYDTYHPRPIVHSWNEIPFYKSQAPSISSFSSGYDPNLKPHFKVPQSTDHFKPSGISFDAPLSFPYNNGISGAHEGIRESKEFPSNPHHKHKVCHPCAPSISQEQLIDLRNKTEQQESKNDNSTLPTSRA
ncbi:hypothetical protein M8J75_004638 [Diaphorina citri]|nr:hypothetical protein M8J75_004638 [Diaphorina citri]KAI5753596.1 hypothetical protein M8J77_001657 [Diaphorina citri]